MATGLTPSRLTATRLVSLSLACAGLAWAAGAARAAEQSVADRFASAISNADLAAVKALIEEGHPVDTPIEYVEKDATPLFRAAGDGRTEIVRYLIGHGANVNYRGSEWGQTPLSQAASRGFDDVVEILITAGADPKVKDRNGYTAFAIAALGGQFDIAEILLKYSDVNGADSYGNTLLMAATTTGQTEAIRWLVGKGADVNKVSQLEHGGRTALIDAAEVGQVESARTLLELGANPHLKMKDGSTALSHAQQAQPPNPELIEMIQTALAKTPAPRPKAAPTARKPVAKP
jgi:ankyrin repeat protein